MKRAVLVALLFLLLFSPGEAEGGEKMTVFVSILPQEYFVSRIGGDLLDVQVMVRPNHSPATYEPQASQLQALSRAQIYFRIGVPFEEVWMEKIKEANPPMSIVDTREGITLRPIGGHSHEDGHHHGPMDPHIWLDPILVKTQAMTIYEHLSQIDSQNREHYQENLQSFLHDLDGLHQELTETLENLEKRNLMVFHPAWGYFADRYQLRQIPIEIDGKEPGPRYLAEVIEFARSEEIGVIFVQEQFSQEAAKRVAEEVGAEVISINPLSLDYIENLLFIAKTIAASLVN